ncbi:uncharacterized protein [Temnothorax nylanderi]|uniref:uncharacterized protein n=1 Tax=Temnothorax nylanderi TaxID=102681 RepID=UPI003A845C19
MSVPFRKKFLYQSHVAKTERNLFVIKSNATKAVIFIDKTLSDSITNVINKKLTVFVDGTFATVPQLKNTNCQLWTIVIRHDNRTFSIVYAIMEGRTAQNYVDVLRKVTNVLKIIPDTVISDFEKAERKTLHTVFPSAAILGCFFHYSQALVHNADKYGILKGNDNELGWGATKLLISLAFLPHTLIEEGFELISKIIFNDCTYLQSFFHYYKQTWINGFKPDSFSVFQQVRRTNNVSERHK